MKNGLQVGDEHGRIVEDTVPNDGFDVVAGQGNTLCIKSSVGKSALVEPKGNDSCDTDEKREERVP